LADKQTGYIFTNSSLTNNYEISLFRCYVDILKGNKYQKTYFICFWG